MIEWLWFVENKEWLFSGAGTAILIAVATKFIKKKMEKSKNKIFSSINIHGDSNISGNTAGRDVVININNIDDRVDELISVFELRAENIRDRLEGHYKYSSVKKYIDRFEKLHIQHIAALKNHNLVLAHEICTSIHEISRSLENDELWSRRAVENPHVSEKPNFMYLMSSDAFQSGCLICEYVVGEMTSNSNRYPSNKNMDSNIENIKSFYVKILESTKH